MCNAPIRCAVRIPRAEEGGEFYSCPSGIGISFYFAVVLIVLLSFPYAQLQGSAKGMGEY